MTTTSESSSSSSSAAATAATVTAEEEDDENKEYCPICLEELPDQVNGQQLIARFICCGKMLCGNCASTTVSHMNFDTRNSNTRNHDHHYVMMQDSTCPMCRTPHAKNDQEQLAMIMKHVEAGKAWAQYQLADRYEQGMIGGVDNKVSSFDKAIELHQMAAAQGYAASMWALGLIYMNGQCGHQTPNITKSKQWLEKAIAKGHAGAMCTLAYHYFSVPGMLNEAKTLLDASVEKHFAYAEYLVATHYHQGVYGYPQDKAKAMEFYKRAALQNSDVAQFNLAGTLYQDGNNVHLALFWWRLCAKQEKSTQRSEALRLVRALEEKLYSSCAACRKKKRKPNNTAGNNSELSSSLMMRCAACQMTCYCNKNCQVFHWYVGHKVECKQVQELKQQVEEARKQNYYFGERQDK